MPMLYWLIVYGSLTLLVGYVLYEIVISELISLNRNKQRTRQERFNQVMDVANCYRMELKEVKNLVIIKKSA
ncbi:hypothetical protein BFR40_07245 [Brochothrix thermosphacta]|uniref:hypothetical protein n=1 Tax=Brochothrix thermosphacta TaxID=2756 RepID=UPI00083FBF08|nr:hypothetical protein [Brochothrix thermosphacta]ANZ98184.1 hypothetical protein BFC20_10965 [Brochothrix thermosphacta]ODJ51788.1 hypothetical protein BFR40_07245 [Brochothrix thermosphacta]